jgi:hypothetical protein
MTRTALVIYAEPDFVTGVSNPDFEGVSRILEGGTQSLIKSFYSGTLLRIDLSISRETLGSCFPFFARFIWSL